MSGSMSFLNGNTGTGSTCTSTPQQYSSSSTSRYIGDQSQGSRSVRGSLSFRDGSSILSSFIEEEEEGPKMQLEDVRDNDVWGNRIVFSALVDIVFSEVPHPKLPPDVIQALQKFLLSVNVATSACNPFVEYERALNTTADTVEDDPNSTTISNQSGGKYRGIPKLELSQELVEGLTPECKVVLKSLIAAYIRKQVGKIREFWKPILENNGTVVPELPEPSILSSATQRRSVGSAVAGTDDGPLKELLDLILNQAKAYKNRSEELDGEVEELLKKKNEEIKKYERDVNKFKKLVLGTLKEQTAQENPEFGKRYFDYLNLETESLNQQTRLEKLKIEKVEQGTEEEQKERLELYNQVKLKNDKLHKDIDEMQDRLEKYKSLGTEYSQILENYKICDEDVKLKEWVVEQLANGPKDESLFNDSFTD